MDILEISPTPFDIKEIIDKETLWQGQVCDIFNRLPHTYMEFSILVHFGNDILFAKGPLYYKGVEAERFGQTINQWAYNSF